MNASWWAAVMLAGACSSGCYRYAEVPLERAQTLQSGPDGRSLKVDLQGGGSQTFAKYDEVVVELVSPGGATTDLELKAPLRASLDAQTLRLSTPNQAHELRRDEVESVTLQQYAPSRPLLIAGIAAGALVLGAIAGGSTASCSDEDFCGYDRAAKGGLGGLIGLGMGLVIGIPVTSHLSSERSGPVTDEPWRPHAD